MPATIERRATDDALQFSGVSIARTARSYLKPSFLALQLALAVVEC